MSRRARKRVKQKPSSECAWLAGFEAGCKIMFEKALEAIRPLAQETPK